MRRRIRNDVTWLQIWLFDSHSSGLHLEAARCSFPFVALKTYSVEVLLFWVHRDAATLTDYFLRLSLLLNRKLALRLSLRHSLLVARTVHIQAKLVIGNVHFVFIALHALVVFASSLVFFVFKLRLLVFVVDLSWRIALPNLMLYVRAVRANWIRLVLAQDCIV